MKSGKPRGTRTQAAIKLTSNQAAYDEIQNILAALPNEEARKLVLLALLIKRCKKCFDYDPQEQFRCCYDSREG